jgi:hypothetical protein
MECTRQANRDSEMISRTASLIEKVHSCEDCPIRRLASGRPESVFGRMHAWHKTWWPGWKAHRARMCALTAGARTRA